MVTQAQGQRRKFHYAYRTVQFQGGRVVYCLPWSRRDYKLLQPKLVIRFGTPVAVAYGRGFTDWMVFDDVGEKRLPMRPTDVKITGEVRTKLPTELALALSRKHQTLLERLHGIEGL